MAEVDGNRTRQTENLGFIGFEDRGAHQERVHLHAIGARTDSNRINQLDQSSW